MNITGIFYALFAAIFFGLIPTTTKLSYGLDTSPGFAIILRYTIATLIVLMSLILIKINIQLIRKHFFALLVISFGSICLTSGLLTAVIFIPVSLVALIFYIYPLIILCYLALNGKTLNTIQIAGFITAFIGLGMALAPSFQSLNIIGIVLALLASIGAAIVLITNEHLSKYIDSITINAFVNFSCLIFFCLTIIINFNISIINFNISLPSSKTGWILILSASLFYCIAFYIQLLAVQNIGSARTSLLLYLEPLVAITSAIFLLEETLSSTQVIGTLIVIFSLIVTTLQMKKINQDFDA